MIRNKQNASTGEGTRIQSVHRALILVKLLASTPTVTVSHAADALEVNPSTAQRLLATLVADGFATRDASRRYAAGPEIRRNQVQQIRPVQVRLRPHLERLYTRVQETVHVASLIGTEVHHLDGVEASTRALRFGLRTGVILPAAVTSSGKIMLAELPVEEIGRRYAERWNPAVIDHPGAPGSPDPAGMESILRAVAAARREGLGMNFGESEEGVAAFSQSLGIVEGQHVALSIAMPSARFTPDMIDRFRHELGRVVAELRTEPTPDH